MKSRPIYLIYLWLILVITTLACSMTSNLTVQPDSTPTRPRRYVVFPGATPTAVPGLTDLMLPEAAMPPGLAAAPSPTRRPRPTATPDNFARLFADVLRIFSEPTATPTDAPRLVQLPTVPPTSTSTATFIPTAIPLPTATPTLALVMPTPLPPPTLPPTPIPSPIEAPPPAPASVPVPTQTPAMTASTFSSPVNPPAQPLPATAAAAPAPIDSGYDFMLAEFFNSPTTNAILVIYVAIVDPNEIPIGDVKVVGTRLDHNLTYESPLSTWHYEGYNAPGEVVKSGNVKFEPPSGMETTNWVLHLEDPTGKRLSEDVPFKTDANDKQWYFIKFKRKF